MFKSAETSLILFYIHRSPYREPSLKKCQGTYCKLQLPLHPGGSLVKNPPAKQEMQVGSLGQEDPLEKGMATFSSILAWKIPWTEEPGEFKSMGSQKEQDVTWDEATSRFSNQSSLTIAIITWMMPPACQWNHKLKLTQLFSYYLIIFFFLFWSPCQSQGEFSLVSLYVYHKKKLLAERNCIFNLLEN